MATQTAAEVEAMLADVNSAITSILKGGQAYSRTGFQFSRASLGELTKLRVKLETQLRRMGTAGGVIVGDFNTAASETEGDEWGDT